MRDMMSELSTPSTLSEMAADLKAITDRFAEGIKALKARGDLNEVCRAYKVTKDAYERMDTARKAFYAELEHVSRATIPELLDDADVRTMTLDFPDGSAYRFGKNQRVTASILDKVAAMDWLRENGNEGLIQPTINSSSLSTFAKEYAKAEGKDLPSEIFKVGTMIVTSVTKA